MGIESFSHPLNNHSSFTSSKGQIKWISSFTFGVLFEFKKLATRVVKIMVRGYGI